jgi:hypothetical protein
MAKSQSDKIYEAKVNARTSKEGHGQAHYAAQDYVWKGLDKTGLSYTEQNKLAKKLIPVVKARIQEDFNKTAMRAKMIESTQKRKAIKSAKEEIIGGGKAKAAPKPKATKTK